MNSTVRATVKDRMANYAYDNVMLLADDVSRSTTLTYRANNEIDTATDYNGAGNYTFDAWGRTNTEAKNGTTKTYSWTSANLLAGINSSNPAETDVGYVYTGDLKRIWRTENGALTNWYQWDAGFNVTNEFSNVNPMKTFAPGLAEVSGNTPGTSGTYNYLTQDHLGSTRGMWDGSAAQTGAWEFTPYGSPYNFAGPSDVTQLYTGHDFDRVTGQYYAPFRYLNPSLGRWGASDPAGMVDGPNMFAYIGGDPMNSIDEWGLRKKGRPGEGVLDDFGLGGDRLNNARVGSWSPIAPAINPAGASAAGGAASFYEGLTGLDFGCNPAPSAAAELVGTGAQIYLAAGMFPHLPKVKGPLKDWRLKGQFPPPWFGPKKGPPIKVPDGGAAGDAARALADWLAELLSRIG